MNWCGDLTDLAKSRPKVRVNQIGFASVGPKRASWIGDAQFPRLFSVERVSGFTEFEAESTYSGFDLTSGMEVHILDFSGFEEQGEFRIRLDKDLSSPFTIGMPPYQELLRDSLHFFYLQRSGIEIEGDLAPGYVRPAGHVGVLPNTGDLAVPKWTGFEAQNLYPGWECPGTFDVSGGWYDAGDHGKYVVSGGVSAALLLSAHERLIRRHGRVPEQLATQPSVLDEELWEVVWMAKMQVPEGMQYAGMAFHRVHDAYWTTVPMMPHLDPAPRVLHRPSTAATLNLAAVAAQAARLVRVDRSEFSAYLLAVAERAYHAARRHPALHAPNDKGAFGGGPYNDDNVEDEFYWAAVELFLTTGADHYRDAVAHSTCHRRDVFDTDGFDCERVAAFARLQLGLSQVSFPQDAESQQSILDAADRLIALQSCQPWGQPYNPVEWDWGSTGRILNNLIVIATAYDLSNDPIYVRSLLEGIDYLFGRNPIGLSFVTGFGVQYSHQQRVRHFANALDPSFPPPPAGSLAGGPASKSFPGFPGDSRFRNLPAQLCYVDEPTSETTNDVCVRWNASLVWISAFLSDLISSPQPV